MNKTTTLLFILLSFCIAAEAQKKGKDKDKGKSKKEPAFVDYQQADPVPDTSRRFTGIIKYRITRPACPRQSGTSRAGGSRCQGQPPS